MDFLYFAVGVLTGVGFSILNILAYKKEVQARIKGFISNKASVVDMSVPFSELDLTQ